VSPPREVFDAHLHIIDPRFPLRANRGWLPEPFTVGDYRETVAQLPDRVIGGAVIAGSFQPRSADQTHLIDAIAQLGPRFVGVASITPDVTDAAVRDLHASGVRAVRVNVRRAGRGALQGLESFAVRLHRLVGWHVEVYLDGDQLAELEPRLMRLPRLAIDHLGLPRSLGDPGFAALLRLVESGAWVKASGFGRQHTDVRRLLREVADVRPSALVFGTDLPSTRAPRPFRASDVDQLVAVLDQEAADLALRRNALELYRLRPLRV
jgi:predicted TIM-barrel fold metal-dependent hydrolase